MFDRNVSGRTRAPLWTKLLLREQIEFNAVAKPAHDFGCHTVPVGLILRPVWTFIGGFSAPGDLRMMIGKTLKAGAFYRSQAADGRFGKKTRNHIPAAVRTFQRWGKNLAGGYTSGFCSLPSHESHYACFQAVVSAAGVRYVSRHAGILRTMKSYDRPWGLHRYKQTFPAFVISVLISSKRWSYANCMAMTSLQSKSRIAGNSHAEASSFPKGFMTKTHLRIDRRNDKILSTRAVFRSIEAFSAQSRGYKVMMFIAGRPARSLTPLAGYGLTNYFGYIFRDQTAVTLEVCPKPPPPPLFLAGNVGQMFPGLVPAPRLLPRLLSMVPATSCRAFLHGGVFRRRPSNSKRILRGSAPSLGHATRNTRLRRWANPKYWASRTRHAIDLRGPST